MNNHKHGSLPARDGLYDPANEHDACGVGFVVNMRGEKSHILVHKGLEILVNLTHRGACGCDPETGDGAGILTQIPHKFFSAIAPDCGFTLPEPGDYGLGCVFLPQDETERKQAVSWLEQFIAEEGQTLLGWRDVPIDNDKIGYSAREAEPMIRQIFIARGDSTPQEMLEWKLYVIRKRFEIAAAQSQLTQKSYCYLPSLSSQIVIYKGLLLADQVEMFFADLADERFESALALVHQRYSTNTFPAWELGQPFRYLAHNGEINTLRGNENWMHARESMMKSEKYGPDLHKIFPICTEGASDSAVLDNALELLVLTGRTLPEAMSMLIPEPWSGHESMSDDRKAYYEYQACLMEPWDGPASIAFTNGKQIGAVLDRNGLRPSRYWVTKDDHVIMASEAGVLQIPSKEIVEKGRLQPGKMFLVDIERGCIVRDHDLKSELTSQQPYREWISNNQRTLDQLPEGESQNGVLDQPHTTLQRAFGYTLEDLRIVMTPMAETGKEGIGSMGNDAPLAVLSDRPQLLYSYFKQLFAQVTNPPLDAIREELVTSLVTTIGSEGNLLEETEEQCALLRLDQPILTNEDLAKIKSLNEGQFKSQVFNTLFTASEGMAGMQTRLEELCSEVSAALENGVTMVILSDRGVDSKHAPIPALLSTSAVHQHLVRAGTRTHCGIVCETGEPHEVHHFALLSAYGAGAINPYLAFATLDHMREENYFEKSLTHDELIENFIKAIGKGLLKVMSKMGISTLQSYRGAQIFEALGLNQEFIEKYFTKTPSRISGVGLEAIAKESLCRHEFAWPRTNVVEKIALDVGGLYQVRRKGEAHLFSPDVVTKLQHSTLINSKEEFKQYSKLIDDQQRNLLTLRGLLDFHWAKDPIPLDEVEPAKEIVKRFATGAMSFGSISKEAHETLAIAMNRLGGKSNTGEGGEDTARFTADENGDLRRSAIKQVASGRFGVTSHYLVNADEIQIKMAQGAKPGEGGQLPGHKVDKNIAKIRHSTRGVGLISPPPHHDIYSIEDMAQLIHDLKNANRHARINVKLVAEVGVGTVAAGVSKGKSDVILISGYDGGTGASALTSIRHAGLPWELGLAETHQVLLKNNLRSRVVLQTDGQLRTARDIAIATLLGAEEWGIATAALVVTGCIMMRKCHLNTCPVGIATQDPELRKKFDGKPEHVVNFFFMIAEELREIMAKLGFKTIQEMVGKVEKLSTKDAIGHWKAQGLDFSTILHKPDVPADWGTYCSETQDHGLDQSLDIRTLLDLCKPALDSQEKVTADLEIKNIDRTVGTILSSEITKKYGAAGLPDDTIELNFTGSAGQSIMAFGVKGITARVSGDVNDYCGKGLCGGKLIVAPPEDSPFVAEENIIGGNVVLYGATSGEVYMRGIVGERFCVRNSGANAVVEGVGDHGCEYMTGGRVVILGETGRNFAAGMSGGIAYVLDEKENFKMHVNMEMVDLEDLSDPADEKTCRTLIEKHIAYTGSELGKRILENWDTMKSKFVKVMPVDYKRALEEMAQEEAEEQLQEA